MSDEPSNSATPIATPPVQADAPVIGYRNIVDDRRPTPWLELLGLTVSVGAILFYLLATVALAGPTLDILLRQRTGVPWALLFYFALSSAALYLSCLSTLTYAGWVRYGRPRRRDEP